MGQHFVVVEVALGYTPIPKRDLATQRHAQPHDGATFELRTNTFRVDLWAAVNRHIDAHHSHLVGVLRLL